MRRGPIGCKAGHAVGVHFRRIKRGELIDPERRNNEEARVSPEGHAMPEPTQTHALRDSDKIATMASDSLARRAMEGRDDEAEAAGKWEAAQQAGMTISHEGAEQPA